MNETYGTLRCTVKVSDRVFTSEQIIEGESPVKYIIKDLEGKLLCQIIFKDKETDGIADADLLAIIIDRLSAKQEGIGKKREVGFALARAEESLLWLNKIRG
jgi:hypothetical protein